MSLTPTSTCSSNNPGQINRRYQRSDDQFTEGVKDTGDQSSIYPPVAIDRNDQTSVAIIFANFGNISKWR